MSAYLEEQDFTAKKVDYSLWRRLAKYALRHRRLFAAIVASLILVALIDTAYPLFTNYALDNFVLPRSTAGLLPFSALYIFLVCLQGSLTFFFISRAGRMEMKIAYDIRQDAFRKLQEQSFSYYDNTSVGYLLARMVSDIANLSDLIAWSVVDVVWAGFYIFSNLLVMFIKNWKLALIVVSVIVPMALVSRLLQRLILKYKRESRKRNSIITGAFNEGIMGAMTTKTLVREDANQGEFQAETEQMRRVSVKASLYSACFFPLIISLGAIGTGMALVFGTNSILNPDYFIAGITVGTLVAFIVYASNLFDPIHHLAHIWGELQGAQASAERVLALMDAPIAITDTPEVMARYGDVMQPKRENWEPVHGEICFEHVDFSYKADEPILRDFNLHIARGETVALVGETGAGKSTLVNLICRFYEPTGGRILIDGTDYKERSQLWLQSSLGYVLQTPRLFSGTVADNIRFGKPTASHEDVVRAATLANAHSFIEKLEKAYDTQVGEGGILLSTGQKQLISFARVICADPRIFVLDEATSSIDTETELLLQNATEQVLRGRTNIVVAHRLSTIAHADRILVIHDGEIVESGSHEELLAKKSTYYHLYMQQFVYGKLPD